MPVIIKKCEFYTKKTNFIGFIIKLKQISIDLKKIKAIVNWQNLKNITDLKLFKLTVIQFRFINTPVTF